MDEANIDDMDKQVNDATVGAVAASAPAGEDISGDRIGRLADALNEAVEALAGGQLKPVELAGTPTDGPIPPELSGRVVAAIKALTVAAKTVKALKAYDLSEDALATNDGVEELIATLHAIANDQKVVAALSGGKGATESVEDKAEPEAEKQTEAKAVGKKKAPREIAESFYQE